jgi:SPP1 family predicted phage head-tail adaptor
MPIYHVGELDEQISVETRVETLDAGGGDATEWELFDEVLAKVVYKKGDERPEGGQLEAQSLVVFVIHKRTDLSPNMRINWQGELYNIRSITPGKKRLDWWMEIEAQAGVAQ